MKLILTHIGSNLPEYIRYCWRQLRYFNNDIDIIMLMSDQFIQQNKSLADNYDIQLIPYEVFNNDEQTQLFNKLSWFKAWGTPNTIYPSPPNFVYGTSARLFYLNALIKNMNLVDVFHIENDIMVYCHLKEIFDLVKNNIDFTATKVGKNYMSCGFIFIPKPERLNDLCNFYLEWMNKGNNAILKENPQLDMVHEMTLFTIYDKIQYLPILPTDNNYSQFGGLFDPASWGQYLGGTNNQHNSEGWAGSHHYIGEQIIKRKYIAKFDGSKPVVIDTQTEETYPLFNLHIHCKRLERFLSNV